MIFGYDELKECITEDFERFYHENFNEKQVFPAVLDEYRHGEDFSLAENICIHVFLAMNYRKQKWNYSEITEKLKLIMNDETDNQLKLELGNEYMEFMADFHAVMENSVENRISGL